MKKALHLGLSVALVATITAGCGSSSNSGNGSGSATSAPPAATPAETKAVTPAKKVELKVFMGFPRFKDQFDKYFEQFKAKEKAEKNLDVTINLEMPNPDQAKQILQTRLASNDAPDLFTLHAGADIPTWYKAGYLGDLSSQPFVSSLFDNVKKTVTYDGKIVALPLESLEWGYLYNKKIFSDLGLKPPQTLDEMKTVAEKIKANKIAPFVLSFQESWIPQLMMALSLGGVVNSSQPDWIEKMNKGQASYKDVQDVFNIIDIIMQNGTDKPFEVGSAQGSTDFANGKGAMWVQGPWQAEAIQKANPKMEFGVAPLPVSNDPKGAMINLSTSTSLAISPTSKNKEVALDLLNYILDPKDSSALFEQLKFNPVSKVHTYKSYPWIDEAMTYVSQGKAYQDLSLPNGVTDEQAKLLQSYYAKQVKKEDIIKSLDKKWADAIKAQK
ncbi:extracellular solute-binding protein [Paenibacillus sp. GP183]|jgi:raffinose/stachyose/melibiose transport system substrate-binding protein|uniref:ABC transporter substrate-binding protein n=1 Tax=Paenibacillus sp. GP183 TaxID=1882751 RepID=UPI00089893A4|nr:extracellular solute-binding protein [Paenibacillus sp. GP183]SEC42417.1 raffinose/stachyose/melibiose transport system substrate-binding protein [Paenibacillus sp. GP183]